MNLLNYVSKITGINNNYFTSSIESILVLFILRLSDKVFQFINNKFNKNDKNKYKLNKSFTQTFFRCAKTLKNQGF